jgi:predicted ATPase
MAVYNSAGYVYELKLLRNDEWREGVYPYSLPAVRGWDQLKLHDKVTFFVGENGSGKSTLVEAVAVAWGFNPEGGTRNFNFGTRDSHSPLHRHLRLVKTPRRAQDGFFLRAESYFNVATEIERLDAGGGGPPIVNSYGGTSLHEMSHGQSFMALIDNRFRGHGFYVLDEPEAALSPNRQLAFLARLHELVLQNSQFIVATHSPIILGYPDATIYELTDRGVDLVAYEDLEHVQVTRNFLTRRQTFLNVLMADDDP